MTRRSFRLRLALISMGLSGLVLLVFGGVTWWSLSQWQLRALDAELTTFGYRFASRSGPNVSADRQEETLAGIVGLETAPYRFFAVMNPDRGSIQRSSHWPESLDPEAFPAGEMPLDPQPEVILPVPKPGEQRINREPRLVYEPRFYTIAAEGRRYRIGVYRNPGVILVTGADLDQFSRDVTQLRNAFLVALPAALAVIAVGAWWLGRNALEPIQALEREMESVSARELDQRLEVGRADIEFVRIIETYNAMLERLERSFHQANRFSADASHELKTPLAIMRGTLEQGLERCGDDPWAQEVFSQLLEQTGRQGGILESLLLLSRADAGKLEISAEELPLSELLETWLEDAGLLAEMRDITIQSEIEPGIRMEGDAILLQRVAHNLFSNAVRYNRQGGRIECRLSRSDLGIEWTVANTGEPILEADRERIFERFERAPLAEGDIPDGVGLGLSLAREIVVAHGGSISVSETGEGLTEFRVLLANISPA